MSTIDEEAWTILSNTNVVLTSAAVIIGLALLHHRATTSSTKPNQTTSSRASSSSTNSKSNKKSSPSSTSDSYNFPPIGTLHSCFRECRGTPRQGSFAPSTRGYIEFKKSIPSDSLDGLLEFSHVWLVFIFHQNTNLHHSKRAHNSNGNHSFRSKIKPPKLKGKSVGVLATRTPHRPNAIGITLARVEKIEGRKVMLSALDLIDGTPILDIKPYVTPYDSVPTAEIPHWCVSKPPALNDLSLNDRVLFDNNTIEKINHAASSNQLKFYTSGIDVRRAIVELLTSDVRPIKAYQRSKAKQNDICHFRFDMLLIGFIRHAPNDNDNDGVVATVVEIVIENDRINKELKNGTRARYIDTKSNSKSTTTSTTNAHKNHKIKKKNRTKTPERN